MLARQLLCLLLLMLASTGAAVAQISISSGDAQQGAPGQSLPQTLAVQNFDTAGSWDVLWHINFDETNGASLSHLNDLDTLTSDVVVNIPSGATDGVTLTFGPSGGTVQVDVCPATNPGTGWFCATTPLTFTATAVAPSFSLTKISADPINATVGDGIQATVRVLDGLGLPVAGQDIQFAAAAGSVTPETQTIATDVNGFATATMTALVAGNQPNALSATLDPDGIPANADDQVVSFTFNFLAGPPSFSADLGADNQSGNP
ncbi:MAG: Ig-like domain-containing protein, partial [Xanthomonadales bacterium]|nr:Ig-like domain-containing protein [Xanthomonadales bacterium]